MSHQPAELFSQNKAAISNQAAVLFSHNKSVSAGCSPGSDLDPYNTDIIPFAFLVFLSSSIFEI
jgi:hypothetical protein